MKHTINIAVGAGFKKINDGIQGGRKWQKKCDKTVKGVRTAAKVQLKKIVKSV